MCLECKRLSVSVCARTYISATKKGKKKKTVHRNTYKHSQRIYHQRETEGNTSTESTSAKRAVAREQCFLFFFLCERSRSLERFFAISSTSKKTPHPPLHCAHVLRQDSTLSLETEDCHSHSRLNQISCFFLFCLLFSFFCCSNQLVIVRIPKKKRGTHTNQEKNNSRDRVLSKSF